MAKQSGNTDMIILKTYIHCQGCAGEVIQSLRGFEGVEDVTVNANEHTIFVKGKQADPLNVLERLRYKMKNKHVELIFPIPKPKPKPMPLVEPNCSNENENKPPVMVIVIKILIHCENCAQETISCIKGMKGVYMVTQDAQNMDKITVTGAIEPQNLVEYLYKKSRKYATIVKCEYRDKEKEKQLPGKQKTNKEGSKENGVTNKDNENEKNVYYQYPPQYNPDPLYPCLLLNDENPQGCKIM